MLDSTLLTKYTHGDQPKQNNDLADNSTSGESIINVFPDFISDFIRDQVESYKTPYEFYIGGVLAAASAAIGNSLYLKVNHGWETSASLFICVIGNSGLGKTPALKRCLSPIEKVESQFFKEWKSKVAEYQELDPDDKKSESYPVRREILLTDTTIEAVMRVNYNNPHGLLVSRDELLGWFKSMNAYKSGADIETWLSIWSGSTAKITRQNGNEYTIPRPYVPVIGGIQPGKLKDTVKGGNLDNGLFYRFLYCFPEDQRMRTPHFNGCNPEISDRYENTIMGLCFRAKKMENTEEGYPRNGFPITDAARSELHKYRAEITDIVNNKEDQDGSYQSMITKLFEYTLRLSLILHVLDLVDTPQFTFTNSTGYPVQPETVKRAIKLTQWFIKQSERAFNKALGLNGLDDLEKIYRDYYLALPESFTTKQAKEIAEAHDISRASVTRFLAKDELFEKPLRGQYQKKF